MKLHKLTKLDAVDSPTCPTAENEAEYRFDISKGWPEVCRYENLSPNVGYWVVGEIISEVVVGKALRMNRINRNGTPVSGFFQTSTVEGIKDNLIFTRNSVYRIEDVSEEDGKKFIAQNEDLLLEWRKEIAEYCENKP